MSLGFKRMNIAYWIPKSTNTLSEYVILIASPLQQRLHVHASPHMYTHSACLVQLYSNIQQAFYRTTKKSCYKFGALNKPLNAP
jgi:hypothetical protein